MLFIADEDDEESKKREGIKRIMQLILNPDKNRAPWLSARREVQIQSLVRGLAPNNPKKQGRLYILFNQPVPEERQFLSVPHILSMAGKIVKGGEP